MLGICAQAIILVFAIYSLATLSLAGTSPSLLLQTLQNSPSWTFRNVALDFDFQAQRYWNSGASTTLTVTRATAETCTSVGGTISYVASGVPCITDAGMQVWQAATNLILQSQFAATWTATRSTVTANAVASPDGSTNAATLIEDSTATNTHLTTQSITKAASALGYVFSVYAKTSTRTRIDLQLDDNAGNGAIMVCDLSGQQVGVTAAGVGTAFTTLSSHATAVGAWTRCDLEATSNTATTLVATVFLDSGSGTAAKSNSYSGDGASGAPVFAAQVEQNSLLYPSPYVPTTTVSATRNKTDVSRTISVGPVYTLYGAAIPTQASTSAQAPFLAIIDDGTANNFTRLERVNATGAANAGMTSGGVSQYSQSGSAWSLNVVGKLAVSVSAGAQNAASNGTAITSGTGATLPVSPTTIHFGERYDGAGTTQWNGNLSRVAVFNSFMSQSQLNSLTTQ